MDFDEEGLHSVQEADHDHGHSLYHIQEGVEEELPISGQDLGANADKQGGQEAEHSWH